MIAQAQGDYAEARQLYGQSLEIKERLGDQGGRATTLGQLGMLAYKQRDFEQALTYTIQAYILFDSLHSPSRDRVRRIIARYGVTWMNRRSRLTGEQSLGGALCLCFPMKSNDRFHAGSNVG